MKASTLSPAEIFGNQIRYVVPLYQRPYVWTKDQQWQPLWDDVSVVADRMLEAPTGCGAAPVSPHFLGAIVIDQLPGLVSHIGVRSVIDGQQRLTTLQLLLDAAYSVVESHGRRVDASALRVLVENDGALAVDPDHVFKVWPTDRDQEAFRAAMGDDIRALGDLRNAVIARGHAFFEQAIKEWAQVEEDAGGAGERLAALTMALREKLRLVVIDLEPGDNAQVIFETLNHRGSPLLAADLVKNLMFQVAAAQGLDVDRLYKAHWHDLDSDYWRQRVARGRRFQPRVDVFLQRWLVMNLQHDVPADRVFTEFRDRIVNRPDVDIGALFKRLAGDAQVHRSWDSLPVNSVVGRFHYRVLQALDNQVVAPVLLWLTRHNRTEMPVAQRDAALAAIESWLIRRALIRATTKDYNNAMIDLLRALERGGPGQAGHSVITFLTGQSAESRYWPNDSRVATLLTSERLYKTVTRPRLRMVLEALEDDARGSFGEGQMAPRGLTIEHVMPVGWRDHWGQDIVGDVLAGEQRDGLVHTLGNLTLVAGRLNPAMSNQPWTDTEAQSRGLGPKGKRDYLLQHSELKLNAALIHKHQHGWDEQLIKSRSAYLIRRIVAVWPCPEGAEQPLGQTAKQAPGTVASVEEVPWGVDDDSIEAAARIWLTSDHKTLQLFQLLIDMAPYRVPAPDLVQFLELETEDVLADLLTRPTQVAAQLGRPLPVNQHEGEVSSYWIDSDVAKTLEVGAQMASSEDFVVAPFDDSAELSRPPKADPARRSTRRRNGTVPDHIREVFESRHLEAELTVREIAAQSTSNYAASEVSQGAISASLNAGRAVGFEWVPNSSPRRIRRRP